MDKQMTKDPPILPTSDSETLHKDVGQMWVWNKNKHSKKSLVRPLTFSIENSCKQYLSK